MSTRIKNRLLVLLSYCILFQILNGYLPKIEIQYTYKPVSVIHFRANDIFEKGTYTASAGLRHYLDHLIK